MNNYAYDLNIVIIGSYAGGKSSFRKRWIDNTFSNDIKGTTVSDFGYKIYEYNRKLLRIQLWDLAGQDKNGSVTKIFSKDAHGCVIVSCTDDNSSREE